MAERIDGTKHLKRVRFKVADLQKLRDFIDRNAIPLDDTVEDARDVVIGRAPEKEHKVYILKKERANRSPVFMIFADHPDDPTDPLAPIEPDL